MHHALAALLVGGPQLLLVVDPAHPHPGAAVVGLHEQRIAEPAPDLAEVEEPGVALQGGLQVGQRLVALGRHHPGVGHRQAQPHHGAVGGLLLHRLDRPGVVEDVEPVHQDRLLDPLPAGVVPVGEPVEDHVVATGLAQVEGLDRDPLDLEPDPVAADRQGQIEGLDEFLEEDRPVQVGAQGKAYPADDVSHPGLQSISEGRGPPYSYTIQSGPGKSQESPSRRRSRQFSQLWPSRAST